jgi:hypothetical protein
MFVLFVQYNCTLEEMGGPSHAEADKAPSPFAASQQFGGRRHMSLGWPSAQRTPERRRYPMQFIVGLKLQGKADHIVMDAEDALIAALKVRSSGSDA